MCQQAADLANRVERLQQQLFDRIEEYDSVIIPLVRHADYDKSWLTRRIPRLWKKKIIDDAWRD